MLFNASVHALRVYLLIKEDRFNLRYASVLSAMLKGNFVGIFLPTGGSELAKIYWLGKVSGGAEKATGVIILARALELIPWGGFILFGVLTGISMYSEYLFWIGLLFVIVFWLVALLVLSVLWAGWQLPFPLPKKINNALLVEREIAFKTIAMVTVLAIPFVVINVLTVWVILYAFSINISYLTVLTIFPTADAVISLPVSINGIGIRELVFSHVLPSIGISGEVSVAIAWTRWKGELGRAFVGAILFLCGNSSEDLH